MRASAPAGPRPATLLRPVTTRRFPEGFRWGTATAAHQVEGANTNNDWWDWEHATDSPCAESSGDACDHWNRFESDIALLAEFGFDSYRLSIEWSRIEPADGEFSAVALDHYRRMCATCLEHHVEPVVTFHHFTTPRWLAGRGGWAEPGAAEAFARFCERATASLGDLIGRACTINEPNVVAFVGYALGLFPPGHTSVDESRRVGEILVDAHRRATHALKAGPGDFPVGLTLSMDDYQAVPPDDAAAIVARDEARELMEDPYLEAARGDDYFGVQCYSRLRYGPDGLLGPEEGEATIRRAWDATGHVPQVVTENGVAHEDDERRIAYVERALDGVLACIDDGIDVRGYTYWSLLDNFEWAFGFAPRFGLVAVDRTTMERQPKPSARWLGGIARANAFSR